jgi:uncharacterized protein YcnI
MPVLNAARPVRSRTGLRVGATALAVATLTLAGSAAAQAHVRVIPESTAGGAFTKVTFRVPSESDTAKTTSVAINLPTDTPLAFVSAQQLDGWTVKIDKTKLAKPVEVEGTEITEAASKITWTAEKGSELAPGEFQEFSLSGGPLPTEIKAIEFPAVQTYSDGTVANWNEPQPEGADEPEHPVPSFELTAALPEGADADAAPPATESATAGSSSSTEEPASSDGLARGLGIGGLIAGLLGLGLGLLAWRRTAAPATPAESPVDGKVGSQA